MLVPVLPCPDPCGPALTCASVVQARARALHDRLRDNVVSNIFREFERTGYIWEQYDDRTGAGKGSHPFTGWSALVVAIMAERY